MCIITHICIIVSHALQLSNMVVFFTCSTKKIGKYASYYLAARDAVFKSGNSVNRDWIDYSINLAKRNITEASTHIHYEDVVASIMTSDAVVVDSTVPSMAIGHQVTIALQNEKPVLLLKLRQTNSKVDKLFIEGSNSPNLEVREYSSAKQIKKIVMQFLRKYESKPKKRFNLVLTGYLNNFLSWASFYYKRTKTELIHEAVENMLEKDSQYKSYLSNNK